MALRTIDTNVEYIKWSEVEKGAVIKGYYMESKPSKNYPDQINHYIETVDGNRYGLNGNANLDRALKQVGQGWYVEITYDGVTKMTSGRFAGKECHQFKFAVDDENIHSLYSGNAATRQTDAQYENPAGEDQAPPQIASPTQEAPAAQAPAQQAPAMQAPAQQAPAQQAAPQQAQADTPEKPKRKAF